ncbi:SCO family protein [Membranicola marinus]|uniref:SCO family protein n=1 Tax=Membranihabitans marinus TaxID=1227546 RepID=A0A953LC11_9BACT|nr:SCO family protein [Membranihabitans marinus]MBY5959051.1 SCO family protein [Membranihabitans marinus]
MKLLSEKGSIFIFCMLFFQILGCQSNQEAPLPILGIPEIQKNGDTLFHTIPEFSLVDQDSNKVTNSTFKNKVYVADFFFTSCPSICPIMTRQMKRIYEQFEHENKLMFLSHSIDTRHDSVPVLKAYADRLNINHDKWRFVTGDKSEIYALANDYFNVAYEDEDAPGGYDHSGKLILVDSQGHIRSFCDGTDPESVDEFMKDIAQLLNEEKKRQNQLTHQ